MSDWYVRCKKLMRDQNLTQADMMPVFGVGTRGAVGHYLTGRRKPSAEQLHAVAKRLGTTTEYLLTGKESPTGSIDQPATIAELLAQAHPQLKDAPHELREAIEALVLRYDRDPAEGQRIAKAIQALLGD